MFCCLSQVGQNLGFANYIYKHHMIVTDHVSFFFAMEIPSTLSLTLWLAVTVVSGSKTLFAVRTYYLG